MAVDGCIMSSPTSCCNLGPPSHLWQVQPSSMGLMQAVAPATMAGSWPSACALCMPATPDLARHSAQHMQLHSLQGSLGLQRQ